MTTSSAPDMPHLQAERPPDAYFYDTKYVQDHTHIPANPDLIPRVIGWSGPARSGTTALLLLMASQEGIDRAYFQPQKTLIRLGRPDYTLNAVDGVICTKEVFGSLYEEENYDPVGHLLNAGVPAEKITWITTLRHPYKAYASWLHHIPNTTPEIFARSQDHALELYEKYKDVVQSVPFAYDLLQLDQKEVLQAVLADAALGGAGLSLSFDKDAMKKKLVLGQASDPVYYNRFIAATAARSEFHYTDAHKPLPELAEARLGKLCLDQYQDFYDHSRKALGV